MKEITLTKDSNAAKQPPTVVSSQRRQKNTLTTKNESPIFYSMNLESGNFDYMGPEERDICGLNIKQIKTLGLQGFEERIHPDDRVRLVKEFESNGKYEELTGVIQYRLRHENGSYQWFRDNRDIIYADDGKPRAIAGVLAAIISA